MICESDETQLMTDSSGCMIDPPLVAMIRGLSAFSWKMLIFRAFTQAQEFIVAHSSANQLWGFQDEKVFMYFAFTSFCHCFPLFISSKIYPVTFPNLDEFILYC